MSSLKSDSPRWSRRDLLTAAGLSTVAACLEPPRSLAATVPSSKNPITALAIAGWHFAYVGSYTPEGPGISLWRVSSATGEMRQVSALDSSNPSWMVLDRRRRLLYTVNEDAPEGTVSGYNLEATNGALTRINTIGSGGATPCHMSLHPSGRYAFIANYGGGNVAVIALQEDGRLGPITDMQSDPGPTNPPRAADSQPGQRALSDHGQPHMHMVQSDAAGRYVLANDAGRDRMLRWKFSLESGKLSAVNIPDIRIEPGSAPRHFAFHPRGDVLYNLQEQDGRISVYAYDPASAALTLMQSVAVYDAAFSGSALCSEILVSANGRYVYAASRIHDTITHFAVLPDGRLVRVSEVWTGTDYPRSLVLDPSGGFLFSCNQKGDAVTSFQVDTRTGALSRTAFYAPVGSPACMVFLS